MTPLLVRDGFKLSGKRAHVFLNNFLDSVLGPAGLSGGAACLPHSGRSNISSQAIHIHLNPPAADNLSDVTLHLPKVQHAVLVLKNKDHQRMMVDPMLLIVQNSR